MTKTKKRDCSYCDHPEDAHKDVEGFYDVRGHRGECGYVGCGCGKYR